MVRVTVVIPVRGGEVALGAVEAIAEGLDIAGSADSIQVVTVGQDTAQAATALVEAGYGDLTMLRADVDSFAPGRWAAALIAMWDTHPAELVILPASADGRDLAPRLAAGLGRPLIAGAVSVDADRAVIPRASGRALAEVAIVGPSVVTLQPGVRSTNRAVGVDPVEALEAEGFAIRDELHDVEVIEVTEASASTMDLTEAPFILGAGVGLGTREAVTSLADVAERLGASVGATRVVTDEGWLGHERQIGTTGVVVDPRVYVAFGVSGAVQHTNGLGAPDHVISVNTDEHCPMMHQADVAIVSDAPAVVDALRRRLDAGQVAPDSERGRT